MRYWHFFFFFCDFSLVQQRQLKRAYHSMQCVYHWMIGTQSMVWAEVCFLPRSDLERYRPEKSKVRDSCSTNISSDLPKKPRSEILSRLGRDAVRSVMHKPGPCPHTRASEPTPLCSLRSTLQWSVGFSKGMCFLIHSMCGIALVHEAMFLFLSIDVECLLQTNNYPSINRPRRSKEKRMVCAGRERGGPMDGGGGRKAPVQ